MIVIKTDEVFEAKKTALELKNIGLAEAKEIKNKALLEIIHTFADNRVIQVRPEDLSNFQLAISLGVDQKWVMKDNTIRLTTIAELEEAMNSGIAQGKTIWDTYIAAIEAL